MMVTVNISKEAHEVVRKMAFEQKKSIGQILSDAVLNNVKVD